MVQVKIVSRTADRCQSSQTTRNEKIITAVTIVLLATHLLATNLASAGPLLCLWLGAKPSEGDSLRERLGERLAWNSVWAMVLGMLTGAILLYFAPSPGLSAAIDRLPARGLWFAGLELLFSLICLVLYAQLWRPLRRHRWWHATLALLAASNLLYHFPPLMSVLGKLAANPRWADAEVLDRATLLPLMSRNEVLALSTHYILASLAVAAIAVLWLLSKTNKDEHEPTFSYLARRAALVAFIVTTLQIPTGIWLLVSLPQNSQTAMMGASMAASLAFLGSLLLTFLLMQRLLTIAMSTTELAALRKVGWTLGLLVLLMTTTLQTTRVQRPMRAKQETLRTEQEKSREAISSAASGFHLEWSAPAIAG